MKKGLAQTGVPTAKELAASPGYPPPEALARGPLAVIECVQEIPCNPCETACPSGAIAVGEPITNLPRLDPARCTGCGLCIAACPGQAIFRVDLTYAPGQATVSFPYEFLPLPAKGAWVIAVGRDGQPLAQATVVHVANPAAYDHTPVVTITVPGELAMQVRSIRRERAQAERV